MDQSTFEGLAFILTNLFSYWLGWRGHRNWFHGFKKEEEERDRIGWNLIGFAESEHKKLIDENSSTYEITQLYYFLKGREFNIEYKGGKLNGGVPPEIIRLGREDTLKYLVKTYTPFVKPEVQMCVPGSEFSSRSGPENYKTITIENDTK